jgi:hypothetical protein
VLKLLSSNQIRQFLKTAIIAILVQLPTTSSAQSRFDTAEACLSAVNEKDTEAASRYVAEILSWQQLYSPNLVSVATECLASASDLEWFFSQSDKRFFTGAEAAAARRLDESAEELGSLECEAVRLVLELNALEDVSENVAEARSLETLSATVNACVNSYETDPIDTLLNPVCFEVFSSVGLPDSEIEYPSERISEVRIELAQTMAKVDDLRPEPIVTEVKEESDSVEDCSAFFEN